MKHIFDKMFPDSYKSLEITIQRFVSDSSKIVDVGSGDCKVAQIIDKHFSGCEIYCFDSDKQALDSAKSLSNNELIPRHRVFNKDGSIHEIGTIAPDCTIFHRSLHHITPLAWFQDKYLDDMFNYLNHLVIIGDVFVPYGTSDDVFASDMKILREKSGHSHVRNDYVHPSTILRSALGAGFNLEYFNKFRDSKSKLFYQIVLRKN